MRRWSMWAASAMGAMGAGAGLAVALRRRPERVAPPVLGGPSPAGQAADAADVEVVAAADAPAYDPPAIDDDPREALDAARARLRARADRLRRDIEAAGDQGPGGE